MTYQRISESGCCLSLTSKKIFPIHKYLIEQKGIGILHRALFLPENKYKKKSYKEEVKSKVKKVGDIKVEEIKILKDKINNEFSRINNQTSDLNKKKLFIEQNIHYSNIVKKYVEADKNDNSKNYINIDKTINKIENIEKNMNSNENSDFILSLVGKCFEKNDTKINVSKGKNKKIKCIEYISMQTLFCLINQKKYEFHFSLGKELSKKILNDPKEQEKFLKEYKIKIANKLNINPDNLIFTDVHRGCVAVHSSIINPTKEVEMKIKSLEGKDCIQKVEEKPILEELHIDSSILDTKGDKDNNWSTNSIRGGENYIPPIGWYGIGLKVDNLYENNKWLSNSNLDGEFAVAYLGINNFLKDKEMLIDDLNPILNNVKKIMIDKLYINDNDIRNNNNKCGEGICVFQNPEYAENSAGIVDITGYRMKIIIMCRVNPKKIRQPACFPECWILNPTPDEIRPYRILIKKIPISPFTEDLTNEMILSYSPVNYIISSIKSDDTSILELKYNLIMKKYHISTKENGEYYNDDIFMIRLYSSIYYRFINEYLRNKVVLDYFSGIKGFTETQLRSWICCLQKVLLNNKNVVNDTIVYRGVKNFKFPPEIGVGSKFYLREFLSTSLEPQFAKDWMRNYPGTYMEIIIKNNGTNGHPNYCSSIEEITYTEKQDEILFSCHCYYTVTKIIRNDFVDYVDLICEGCLTDAIPNNYFNEILIDYKINDMKEIKIFGEEFVEKNKNNCFINIKGKEYELCSIINLNDINYYQKENILNIKLKGIDKITDMSSIFKGCSSLVSMSDIYKWNTENITNMTSIFSNCENLTYLPDISYWDTRNVTDISYMFYDCKSLISLPDISKWDTKKVTKMNCIFHNCSTLITLPDISKWNTSNVTEMFCLFYGCSSLISLPNISKWDTSNNKTINGFLTKCISLKNIPDISNWNTSQIYDMNGIFYGCSGLRNIPDISKWDTTKAFYMEYMFFGCSSLESLPDVSKWDTTHTFVIDFMFEGCNKSFDVPKKFMDNFIELKKKLPILLYIKEKDNDKVYEIKVNRKELVGDLKKKIEQELNIIVKNPMILKPKNSGRYRLFTGSWNEEKILDDELLTLEDFEVNGGDTILIE